jgi:hypothetical protein
MKKIAIFITIFILMPGSLALAQEKIDPPIWNVGDKWVYQTADGKKSSNEVVKVEDEFFVVRIGGSPYLHVYDKKTMNITKYIDSSGTEASATALNVYDFPLFVGKKWGGRIVASGAKRQAGGGPWEYSFNAEKIEEIKTVAGSFKAVRLYCKHSNLNPKAKHIGGWMKFWYSPDAKAWVKKEVEKSAYFDGTVNVDTELVSYQLKK